MYNFCISKVGITSHGKGCGKKDLPGAHASVLQGGCFIKWTVKCLTGIQYNNYFPNDDCNNWLESERANVLLNKSRYESDLKVEDPSTMVAKLTKKRLEKANTALAEIEKYFLLCQK